MNISKQTIEQLEQDYIICFYDNNINVVEPCNAVELTILTDKNMQFIGKHIKATKKETTYDYVISKLNAEKIYQSFSSHFNSLLKQNNLYSALNCYPTTYGIGIWVAISYRNECETMKAKVSQLLDGMKINYSTEYSNARWVFRYKISKSAENIKQLESVLN